LEPPKVLQELEAETNKKIGLVPTEKKMAKGGEIWKKGQGTTSYKMGPVTGVQFMRVEAL